MSFLRRLYCRMKGHLDSSSTWTFEFPPYGFKCSRCSCWVRLSDGKTFRPGEKP